MKTLILIAAALALAACRNEAQPPETPQVLSCYVDGAVTVRVEGTRLRMEAMAGPDGRMVERWVIRLPDSMNGAFFTRTAGPNETCGPEPAPPTMD